MTTKNETPVECTAKSSTETALPPVQKPRVATFSCVAARQRTIFDFTLEKDKIGEGTYGKVFKARDKKTNEVVALKQVLISQKDAGLPITSVREIKLLMNLDHENIVKLKEVVLDEPGKRNTTDESVYMVFEFMDHDLSGLIKMHHSSFKEQQIRHYIKQLLEGLYHCHEQKIIHRDIKGANMLINREGVLKLADFGLARRMQNNSCYTKPVVTLWYRSPELLLGTKTYSPAIDMWSVGCLFAELYLGEALFQGNTDADQIDRIYQVCGTPDSMNWPKGMTLPNFNVLKPKRNMKRQLRDYLRRKSRIKIPTLALDLIEGLLSLDPSQRLTAEGALDHQYFYDPPYSRPASLPQYSGNVNELFSKRVREREHQNAPPAKRFKDNNGRGNYRNGDRDDRDHRDGRYRDRNRDRDRRDNRGDYRDSRDRRHERDRDGNRRDYVPHRNGERGGGSNYPKSRNPEYAIQRMPRHHDGERKRTSYAPTNTQPPIPERAKPVVAEPAIKDYREISLE